MDFRQSTQPTTNRPATAQPVAGSDGKQNAKGRNNKWFGVLNLIVLIGAAIIVALVALVLSRGGNNSNDFKFVDQKKYQAVFLNNGQVYFGNIDNINTNYVRLTNIYYLTQSNSSSSSSSSSNGSYSLVKLGCQQIHDPYDQMVINRDQVTFWENLQDNGKVVQSINQFKKQNPNGPDCSQVSNQTQATSTNSSTQGAATTPTNGSGTNTTGK